jgi:hypothetical protein
MSFKMTTRKSRWFVAGLGATLAISATLLFQNCGRATHSNSSLNSAQNDFFQYPYKGTPLYFQDFLVYKPSDSTGITITRFSVMGSMRNIQNPNAAVNYAFNVYGSDGVTPICPEQVGTMTPPMTTLSFDCVSAKPGNVLTVVMTLGIGADRQVLRKTFANY